MIYLILILFIVGSFTYYIFSVNLNRKKYSNIPGPRTNGPIGFLIGDIARIRNRFNRGIHLPEQLYKEEFKSKTIKYRLFNDTIVFSQDPRVIKAVLIDQDCLKEEKIYKKFGFPFGERFSGNGLFEEIDYEKWKHKRAIFNPAFHKQILKSFMKEFNTKIDILMEHLKTVAESDHNEISLLDKFNKTALDVIASVAFNMDIDSLNDTSNDLHVRILDALKGIHKTIIDPFFKINPLNYPQIERSKKAFKAIRKIGIEQIQKRLEAIKNGDSLPDDILTALLNANSDETLCFEELVDQFVTFFVAGQETTANTLASAFLEIGRNPEVEKNLKNEIDTEIGSKVFIEYDDLSKLKYTGCVFKEALRLYPAASGVARRTSDNILIDDITIPKGSTINLSIYACGRNEEYFPEPFSFKPERFFPENAASIQNYTYFPFSLGPRNCIGLNFAQIEAKIVIAKFIQNFDFKIDQNQSFDLHEAITMRPKSGTRGFISLRQ